MFLHFSLAGRQAALSGNRESMGIEIIISNIRKPSGKWQMPLAA
jgi:hypothetical protein